MKHYIIAHTHGGICLEIDSTRDPEVAKDIIFDHTDDGFIPNKILLRVGRKSPDELFDEMTPEMLADQYQSWIRNENDNQCISDVVLKVVECEKCTEKHQEE